MNVKLSNSQLNKLKSGIKSAFGNGSLSYMKLWKTELSEIGQWGKFLGRILGPLLKTGLSLMKNVLKPLATSVLIPLGLTAAAATDAAIQKKIFGLDWLHW